MPWHRSGPLARPCRSPPRAGLSTGLSVAHLPTRPGLEPPARVALHIPAPMEISPTTPSWGNVPGTTGTTGTAACVSHIPSPRQRCWLGKQRQQARRGWAHTKLFCVFAAAQPLGKRHEQLLVASEAGSDTIQTHPCGAREWAHGNFTHWNFTILREMRWGAGMSWESLHGSLGLVSAGRAGFE